jgi:uncharacterized protein (TIGR03435 family)
MFKSYGIRSIPHTVIIGMDGTIAAITRPQMVQVEHLENVIAGKPSGIPAIKQNEQALVSAGEILSANEGQPPLFQVAIRPSKGDARRSFGGMNSKNRNDLGVVFGFTDEAMTVAEMLPSIYSTTSARIVTESPLPPGKFDVFVKGPGERRKALDTMRRQAIETTFGLISEQELRELDTYVLICKDGPGKGLKKSGTATFGSSLGAAGKIECVNSPITGLVSRLESALKQPVIDETGLTGKYDFKVTWKQPDENIANTAGLIAAVHEQLGLDLKLEKRTVSVVVVRR